MDTPNINLNLHTHTYRCKHATGDAEDYAAEAVRQGFRHLGMSDHCPLPDDWFAPVRMELGELDDYVGAVRAAQGKYARPAAGPDGAPGEKLNIYLGMECDYFKDYHNFFKEELLDRRGFDYLIGAAHGYPYQGANQVMYAAGPFSTDSLKAYAEHMADIIRSGLFRFIAHPDLFNTFLLRWNGEVKAACRYILEAAQSEDMPLEINVSGYEKSRNSPEKTLPFTYPMEQFWETAADYKVRVLVSSDAHKPELLATDLAAGYRLANKYGLTLWDFDGF